MNNQNSKGNIKYFFKAVALSIKIKSLASIIISLLGFVAAFFPMLISLQIQSFTNNVQSLFNQPELLNKALYSFTILAILYISQTIFSLVEKYIVAEDTARLKHYLKEKILILLSSVPYKYIENQGEFRERVDFVKQYGAEKTTGSISLIFSWVSRIIAFFGIAVILWDISSWIVVALIVTSIPAVVLSNLQQDETYRFRTKRMKEGLLTWNYSDSCRQVAPMKDIRFFGLYNYLKKQWLKISQDWMKKKKALARKHLIYNSFADILRNGIYLLILLIVAWEIYKNPERGLGAFMLVFSAAGQLQAITAAILINAVSIFTDVKKLCSLKREMA